MSDGVIEQREHITTLEKDLAKTKAALATSLAENRKYGAREVFGKEGFAAPIADLYVTSQPEGELTAEAAQAWASTYGLTAPPVSQTAPAAPVETVASTSLASMGRGGSNPGGSGQPPAPNTAMSIPEWQDLHQRDPDAAAQAVVDGKVALRQDNPWVKGYTQRHNPYQRPLK